jgi:hypothetical protein
MIGSKNKFIYGRRTFFLTVIIFYKCNDKKNNYIVFS